MTPTASEPRRSRVLVVDDNEMVRSVVTRVLESEGHTVEQAGSADVALARMNARPTAWDAVIMDLTMPGMSGADALAVLRGRWAHLPVVIISGFGPPPGPIDPATRFLDKPFTGEQLLAALDEAIGAAGAASR